MGGFPKYKYIFKISELKELVNDSVSMFYDLENSDLLEKFRPKTDGNKDPIPPEL